MIRTLYSAILFIFSLEQCIVVLTYRRLQPSLGAADRHWVVGVDVGLYTSCVAGDLVCVAIK